MSLLKQIAGNFYRPLKRKYSIIRLKNAAKKPVVKIVVGASGVFDEGWVPTDIDYLNLLHLEDWKTFFRPDSIDAILAEHVWEHLDESDGTIAAINCHKFLKPGGHLRIAVPDGFNPKPEYINYVKPGGIGDGADDHKILYNYQSFSRMLQDIGFKVNLLEYFDENGQFHESAWKPEDGFIRRSKRFDPRNASGELNYTSLIIDAIK